MIYKYLFVAALAMSVPKCNGTANIITGAEILKRHPSVVCLERTLTHPGIRVCLTRAYVLI